MALINEAAANSRCALVAMKFDAVPVGTRIARIEARSEGVVSWALTHLGVADRIIYEVYLNHLKIINSSWSGRSTRAVPLSQISSANVGFLKPISNLIGGILLLALSCAIGCDDPLGFVAGGVGLYFLVDYFFSKTISLELTCASGERVRFVAKRSVMEWCPIDENSALVLCDRINELVIAANS